MSEQLFSFEGKMLTLHQIEAIRAEQETVEEVESKPTEKRKEAQKVPVSTKKAKK